MKEAQQFAGVIVDVPGLDPLDYRVPEGMLVAEGDRVMVPLGARKVPGIVVKLGFASQIEPKRLRSVAEVMRDAAPLPAEWLDLTRFAARYYLRSWGEGALPALPLFLRRTPGAAHRRWMEKIRAKKDPEPASVPGASPPPALNVEQQRALEAILQTEGFQTWLLFGVTGSGKTEVYLRLMEAVLREDSSRQALLLVPEINLTPQLEARVRGRFPGERVAVLHSALSNGERAENWLAVHEGGARILVGTRTAVFASFKNLSLVVVDEEHDPSFKAGDGLRFSARDLAVWRGLRNRCPVVLGSATPSLESWMKVRKGDYRLVELKNRAVGRAELPKVSLAPPPARGSSGSITEASARAVRQALDSGRQALIFINRRGYAPVVGCPACGWVAGCPRCTAFAVFHKIDRTLVCHHCGWRRPVPGGCPVCGNVDILPRGTGTERIEEEIDRLFPDARVLRIDRDSTAKKHEAEQAFGKVHRGEVDILVGTQMVAKGHDFKNVGIVLVLNADGQILSPSLRARERLFATLMQVSGRAGRSGKKGEVLIQTRFPEDPLFSALSAQDYPRFADALLEERRAARSIPFVHQALVVAEAESLALAQGFLAEAAEGARTTAPGNVFVYDPVPMSLVRLMNVERAQLLVESEDRGTLHAFLRTWTAGFARSAQVRWTVEIDPPEV